MRVETSSTRELPEMHRMGHTCANLNGELFFVWGGSNDDLASSPAHHHSSGAQTSGQDVHLWMYETLTGYWRRRSCSGECPPRLSGSTSALIGDQMYVFGGHSAAQDNWLNSLYCLDLSTFQWHDLGARARAEPVTPIPSDKCVSWTYNGKLYVFGGYGWSQTEHLLELLDKQKDLQLAPDYRWPKFGWNNQLVEFEPSLRNYHQHATQIAARNSARRNSARRNSKPLSESAVDCASGTWRWPSYSGKCPSARAAHSGALMGDTYYLFGGRDSRERLNDLYTFNMRTFEWQHIALFAPSSPLTLPTGVGAAVLARSVAPAYQLRHLLDAASDELDTSDEAERSRQEQLLLNEAAEIRQQQDEEQQMQQQRRASFAHSDISETDESSGDADTPEAVQQPPPPPPMDVDAAQTLGGGVDDGPGTSGGSRDPHCQYGDESNSARPASLQCWLQRAPAAGSSSQADEADASAASEPAAAAESIDIDDDVNDDDDDDEITGAEQQAIDDTNDEPGVAQDAQVQPAEEYEIKAPIGRSFASFTPISDTKILLYGGISSQEVNLADCWLYDTLTNQWRQLDIEMITARLWHTGARTRSNEVVIIGGSCSDKIYEVCTDVVSISLEPKSLKRMSLDTISRAVRMRSINKIRGVPPTILKLIKLRKQAMALGMRRCQRFPVATQQPTE